MSEKLVRLKVDGKDVSVPEGTLVVDAARKAGISIPVFCYHPRMEPVGMCRMCLVEIGRPMLDRETREPKLDVDGNPVIRFGLGLETACTTPVGEGWDVRVNSPKAVQARKEVVEFLLTSHPLDCPVCDKGGECPLQNLTMAHGPGETRFEYADKKHLAKHVPLGDLIILDRERCIQCGRCVRFQDEIVGEPVIGFFHRGRQTEIMTDTDPGFDSVFSGNTTDICPVGALTTADFRFGARSWELRKQASICSHCPVGCNLSLNTRREARAGGRVVIKRVMPRQNEEVNEIWICDKGRFGHHFAGAEDRLRQPMVRRNGQLVPASWEEACQAAADGLRNASSVFGLAGGRASNEDLYCMRELVNELGGSVLQHSTMAGGEFTRTHGMPPGSNLGDLGEGDAVLVLASDLYEEAPIWWLRVRQAARRGAAVISANSRGTSLDTFATHVLRTSCHEPLAAAGALLSGLGTEVCENVQLAGAQEASEILRQAESVVVFYGREGLEPAQTASLAEGCARLLESLGKNKRPNSGLIGVWPAVNSQGAWDLGFGVDPAGLKGRLEAADALLVMAADPAGDALEYAGLLEKPFTVVQELFLTETARMADVVFPALSFAERDGTYTSGERRVQRFYQALMAEQGGKPDWEIISGISSALNGGLGFRSSAEVLKAIRKHVDGYENVTLSALARVREQSPDVGGEDIYYGGTSCRNEEGLGVQLPQLKSDTLSGPFTPAKHSFSGEGFMLVPVDRLFDRGITLRPSRLLEKRAAGPEAYMNPDDLKALELTDGAGVTMKLTASSVEIPVRADPDVPRTAVLVPRSVGAGVWTPQHVDIERNG